MAILADVLLIGLPTVVGMRGAKKQRTPVEIPVVPALALELLQPVAAVVAAYVAWPTWAGVLVTCVAVAACLLQIPRWRWMFGA